MTLSLENKTGNPSSLAENDIVTLVKTYTLRDQYQVLGFIEEHPFLVPLLLEAPDTIRKVFPDASLGLELFIDAEVAGWVELMLVIVSNVGLEEAQVKLAQLEDEWFFDQVEAIQQAMFMSTRVV